METIGAVLFTKQIIEKYFFIIKIIYFITRKELEDFKKPGIKYFIPVKWKCEDFGLVSLYYDIQNFDN